MARSWYILQTYSQFENRVERNIRLLMEDALLAAAIFDIKVPTERVAEMKNGKRIEKEVKIWPGYILLEMDLPDHGWKEVVSPIKRIQGVSGFVGTVGNNKPTPISNDEVKTILMRSGDIKADKSVLVSHNYKEGDEVRIASGPFESFTGKIEEVNAEKQKLRVMVGIFGRATPVEVDFSQVEKV
ncbi:MAG: transcription termination/antitermination factor NusG [Spirochaetes bacterium GWB1_48_6]|nr:MAG: transcription termination/antitermination factor NusG [Spirochaetes bacterium GWB1_48_6]